MRLVLSWRSPPLFRARAVALRDATANISVAHRYANRPLPLTPLHDLCEALPPAHPRFRPRRLDRGRLRRARQPQAGRDHRPAAGRPADDDDRRRQLARRRARPDGPGADGAHAGARRALRHRSHLRPHPHRRPVAASVPPQGRLRRIHLRCADHRDRRDGEVPRAAIGEKFMGRGVSACATCDGFFYKDRTSRSSAAATPRSRKRCTCPTSRARSTSCIAATRCAPRRSCRTSCSRRSSPGKIEPIWHHTVDEVLGNDAGVTGLRLKSTQDGTTREIDIHGLFVAIGHTPNTSLFEGQLAMNNGYIESARACRATRRRPPCRACSPPATSPTRLSPGRHLRRLRLHGRARRREVPRQGRLMRAAASG